MYVFLFIIHLMIASIYLEIHMMEEGHWLIKKLLGLIGSNIGGWSKQNRILGGRGSELRCHACPLQGRRDEASCQVRHAESFPVRLVLHRSLNMG